MKYSYILIIILTSFNVINMNDDYDHKILYYGEGCKICIENYENELNELSYLGYELVKYDYETYKNDLNGILENIEIPEEITCYSLLNVEGRYFFINDVPVDLIDDFLNKGTDEYEDIILINNIIDDNFILISKNQTILCKFEGEFTNMIFVEDHESLLYTCLLVSTGALLDGINPCAFVILIYYSSFLMLSKDIYDDDNSKKRTFLSGFIYIIGVFFAYLLIGLFLYDIIIKFNISYVIKYLSVFLIFAFSLNNILQFFYPKFGIDLKLSKNAWILSKEQIKKYTYHTSFLSGLIIGLFEFPCTSGVYLSIVNMISTTDSNLKGYFLLLLYNVVFITPLIVLFIIILKTGTKNFSINKWNTQHRSKMKLLTSIITLLLGFVLLMYT